MRRFDRDQRCAYVVNEPVVIVSMMRRPIISSDLARIFVSSPRRIRMVVCEAYLRRPVRPLRRYHTMAAEIETSATTATPRPDEPVDYVPREHEP